MCSIGSTYPHCMRCISPTSRFSKLAVGAGGPSSRKHPRPRIDEQSWNCGSTVRMHGTALAPSRAMAREQKSGPHCGRSGRSGRRSKCTFICRRRGEKGSLHSARNVGRVRRVSGTAMMMRREALSARAITPHRTSTPPLALGRFCELRKRLPLIVEVDGEPFRLLELVDGALVAHGTICPHWLGPLEDAVPENGKLRCPWHGYLFDVRTGASADGRGYRLARAPTVMVDPVTSEVTLSASSRAARATPSPRSPGPRYRERRCASERR